MTLSGVRSSWEASAVNSSWRRRASSTGLAALTPMSRVPKNTATRSTGPAMASNNSKLGLDTVHVGQALGGHEPVVADAFGLQSEAARSELCLDRRIRRRPGGCAAGPAHPE